MIFDQSFKRFAMKYSAGLVGEVVRIDKSDTSREIALTQ